MSGTIPKDAPIKLGIALGWATGELGIASYIGVTMSFMLFYLTQALGISPVWAGIALLVPRLWDAIIDPFVGAISDRTHSKMGRRRPYLLAGALSFGIAFAAIFFAPVHASQTIKIIYVIALYMATSTAFTFYDVPYSAMAAEMTTDYTERTKLVGYKMIAARFGILLTILVAPLVFTFTSIEGLNQTLSTLSGLNVKIVLPFATSTGLSFGFQLMGIVFGVFMVVTGLIAFFATKHAKQITRPVERFNLMMEYRALVENKPFFILWSAFLLQNLAIGATATTLIYYAVFVMHMPPAAVGLLAASGAISATLATPIWVWIAKRVDKRMTYFISLFFAAIFSIPAFFIPDSKPEWLFSILILAGVSDAANQLLPNAMVPDTVEYDEHRTGQRREGTIFGTWAFCRKLGMALGAFLVSVFLSLFGFVGGQGVTSQTPEAIVGIRLAYALIPCVLWIGTILIMRYYSLNKDHFEHMKREISAKRKD